VSEHQRSKRAQMMAFWSERAQKFKADPRANTNDVWLRELEIATVSRVIRETSVVGRILDFGCANGYSTIRIAKEHRCCDFLGIDINRDMISIAQGLAADEKCSNVEFMCADIEKDSLREGFDFVFAIRVFQNMESLDRQCGAFDALMRLIRKDGLFFFLETYAEGYAQINADRAKLDLPPLPNHPHLTLLTPEFDEYVAARVHLIGRYWPTSTYYLTTRLMYSYIAMKNGETINYNHPIHQAATLVPQVGDYGPQRAALFRRS